MEWQSRAEEAEGKLAINEQKLKQLAEALRLKQAEWQQVCFATTTPQKKEKKRKKRNLISSN